MWETLEDVERDLYEYSQLEYPGSSLTTAPPKSVSEYRARTTTSRKSGLFDDQPESKEIFISGRGKHHSGTIIRPGQWVISTPEEDMDIRKKIREVSGLGYGNEIVESFYGRKESSSSDEEDHNKVMALPNLKLSCTKSISTQKENVDSSLEDSKLETGINLNPPMESRKRGTKKKLKGTVLLVS